MTIKGTIVSLLLFISTMTCGESLTFTQKEGAIGTGLILYGTTIGVLDKADASGYLYGGLSLWAHASWKNNRDLNHQKGVDRDSIIWNSWSKKITHLDAILIGSEYPDYLGWIYNLSILASSSKSRTDKAVSILLNSILNFSLAPEMEDRDSVFLANIALLEGKKWVIKHQKEGGIIAMGTVRF